MWKILNKTGIAPIHIKTAEDDDLMLSDAGIGFTDLGFACPGTNRY